MLGRQSLPLLQLARARGHLTGQGVPGRDGQGGQFSGQWQMGARGLCHTPRTLGQLRTGVRRQRLSGCEQLGQQPIESTMCRRQIQQ